MKNFKDKVAVITGAASGIALQNEGVEEPLSPEVEARRLAGRQAIQEGMSPQQ